MCGGKERKAWTYSHNFVEDSSSAEEYCISQHIAVLFLANARRVGLSLLQDLVHCQKSVLSVGPLLAVRPCHLQPSTITEPLFTTSISHCVTNVV